MNGQTDFMEPFTPEEWEAIVASAMEAQREFDAFAEWLQSPDGKAWVAQQLQEITEIAEKFQRECAAGKSALTPDELEQLLAEGRLVKCHPIKRGTGHG